MGQRIVDDYGNISFVDDNAVQCFVDDLNNYTCDLPSAGPIGLATSEW
jgi:hypothetical protein